MSLQRVLAPGEGLSQTRGSLSPEKGCESKQWAGSLKKGKCARPGVEKPGEGAVCRTSDLAALRKGSEQDQWSRSPEKVLCVGPEV